MGLGFRTTPKWLKDLKLIMGLGFRTTPKWLKDCDYVYMPKYPYKPRRKD
uniref:Uncharacterized protein n=1 Tax=Manihot esculenta TaxID=3983 RepID=A0A2C9UPC1_MANES